MRRVWLATILFASAWALPAHADWESYAHEVHRHEMAAEVSTLKQRIEYCYALDCALRDAPSGARWAAERCLAIAGRGGARDGSRAHEALKSVPWCGHLVAFLLENADDFQGRERDFPAVLVPPTEAYGDGPFPNDAIASRPDGDVTELDGVVFRTVPVRAADDGGSEDAPCDPQYALKKQFVFVGATDEELAAAGITRCE